MATLASGQITLRPELATIAYEYSLKSANKGFIAEKVLPTFRVPLQYAVYPYIPIESILKVPADLKRAPRSAYKRTDWTFKMNNYNCTDQGLEEAVDDAEARLYSRFFDAEQMAVLRNMDRVLRNREMRVANVLQNTGQFPFGPNATQVSFEKTAVATPWNNFANATPRDDVMGARELMKYTTGIVPNTLIITERLLWDLLRCDEVKDALKYTTPVEMMSIEAATKMLALYFEIDQVLVSGAIFDKAAEGQPKNISGIWNDSIACVCALSSGGEDLQEPCIGRTFLWEEDSPTPLVVETYREEEIRSWIFRTRQNVGEGLVFTGANYLLTGCRM